MQLAIALSLLTLQPPVGFVSHYPMIPEGADVYGESGATVALVRAPWELIQPSEDEWLPEVIDEQLAWAEAEDVRLIYVVEAGPAHCANWVRELVREAGQTMVGADGGAASDPSIFSPVYVARMDDFVRRVVTEIHQRDTNGRVIAYNNGCEWWYPSDLTFSELDRAAFEREMAHRYGSVRAAREAWGLQPEGAVERPPVVFDGAGAVDSFGQLVDLRARVDASWCTPYEEALAVEPGTAYTFSAQVRTEDDLSGGALLQIAWLKPGSQPPIAITDSERVRTGGEWRTVSVTAEPSAGADRAWLHLKSQLRGTVEFRNVAFRSASDGATNLAPPIPAAGGKEEGLWGFSPWAAGVEEALVSERGDGALRTRYSPTLSDSPSARWVEDWFDFTGNAVAEFIGHVADVIRDAAPGAPIVTYLTFSFAAPFNWDYSYQHNIHPWRVFSARHYEGLGMQLAAADGDFHHITAGVDMVKHQGEPWLIDLQDFTAGVWIGSQAMTRTTLSGIASGARGVVYYCWWGTPDYDFYNVWPDGELEAMLSAGRDLLARCEGGAPAVDVAILHPMTVPYAGRGEPDPGRFMLLYKALRRLGLGIRIVASPSEVPASMPFLTLADVPADLPAQVRRFTEKGNTPPMFKFLGPPESVEALAARLAERLGAPVPEGPETFPWISSSGERSQLPLE